MIGSRKIVPNVLLDPVDGAGDASLIIVISLPNVFRSSTAANALDAVLKSFTARIHKDRRVVKQSWRPCPTKLINATVFNAIVDGTKFEIYVALSGVAWLL